MGVVVRAHKKKGVVSNQAGGGSGSSPLPDRRPTSERHPVKGKEDRRYTAPTPSRGQGGPVAGCGAPVEGLAGTPGPLPSVVSNIEHAAARIHFRGATSSPPRPRAKRLFSLVKRHTHPPIPRPRHRETRTRPRLVPFEWWGAGRRAQRARHGFPAQEMIEEYPDCAWRSRIASSTHLTPRASSARSTRSDGMDRSACPCRHHNRSRRRREEGETQPLPSLSHFFTPPL